MQNRNLGLREIIKVMCLVVCCCAGMGCKREFDPQSFVKEVRKEGNGIRKSLDQGVYFFDLQFQPAEYMALLRMGSHSKINLTDFEAKVAELSGLQYFTLTIGSTDANLDFIKMGTETEEEQAEKIHFFSYAFQNSLILTDGEERISPVLYHFERSVDMRNSRTFVLAFEPFVSKNPEIEMEIRPGYFSDKPVLISIDKSKSPKLLL